MKVIYVLLLEQMVLGKTTTIKSIVGIHTFDHGEVKLFNINLKDNPEYYKSFIGYSPDTPDLYNNMTGKHILN